LLSSHPLPWVYDNQTIDEILSLLSQASHCPLRIKKASSHDLGKYIIARTPIEGHLLRE
jgi:hypothetical protein